MLTLFPQIGGYEAHNIDTVAKLCDILRRTMTEDERDMMIAKNVSFSSAIEGIHVSPEQLVKHLQNERAKLAEEAGSSAESEPQPGNHPSPD